MAECMDIERDLRVMKEDNEPAMVAQRQQLEEERKPYNEPDMRMVMQS